MNGTELYFESADTRLSPAPELFASALLPVAAGREVKLVMDAPIDPCWRRNAAGVLRVWSSWWGTPARLGRVLKAQKPQRERGSRREPATGVGLCFSLGVDSFHSLLRSGREVDQLILAEGFDVPLGDRPRIEHAESALREVAESTGCRAIVIRTNLREHRTGRRIRWPRAHGGPLAALGHACSDEIGELLISSTKPYVANQPWGSHWETDPGWSSSRLRVSHVGAEHRRNDKLATIADEPLVRKHLRVCWENRSPAGNCGECEKCVRTMLILTVLGRVGDFPAFPKDRPIAASIDSVPLIRPDSAPVYEAALAASADPELGEAVERLLARSPGTGDHRAARSSSNEAPSARAQNRG